MAGEALAVNDDADPELAKGSNSRALTQPMLVLCEQDESKGLFTHAWTCSAGFSGAASHRRSTSWGRQRLRLSIAPPGRHTGPRDDAAVERAMDPGHGREGSRISTHVVGNILRSGLRSAQVMGGWRPGLWRGAKKQGAGFGVGFGTNRKSQRQAASLALGGGVTNMLC